MPATTTSASCGAEILQTQHPLVPIVRALTAAAGDAGRYVHYGATTQDIMDTACVLQVRDGLALLTAISTTSGTASHPSRGTTPRRRWPAARTASTQSPSRSA